MSQGDEGTEPFEDDPEVIADSEAPEDQAPGEPATVEEPAKRQVAVVIDGVFHGMREE